MMIKTGVIQEGVTPPEESADGTKKAGERDLAQNPQTRLAQTAEDAVTRQAKKS